MNLILQIWDRERPPLVQASIANLNAYARTCGAEYGLPVGAHPSLVGFSPQAQKLAMLSIEWDVFDTVAMMDCDMFAVHGLTENLFDVPGHGFHQVEAHKRVCSFLPKLTSYASGFYGGCLYKFSRDERRALRAVIDMDELKQFDNASGGWDEGMIHRLCLLADLPTRYLSALWCWGSYFPFLEKAKMIHVRSRPTGDKLKNLRALQAAGVVA